MKSFPTLLVPFALLVVASCNPNKKESTSLPADSSAPDTISVYLDLTNITVFGDSIKLDFGAKGGDGISIRRKIVGQLPESVVGRAFAGLDELEGMPDAYSPTIMAFSYSGTPNKHLLGTRYFLKYQPGASQPVLHEIRVKGDVESLKNGWMFLGGKNGDYYFAFDGTSPPRLLYFNPAKETLSEIDRDTTTYQITQILFTDYGRKGKILFKTDAYVERKFMDVTFEHVYDENSQYRWTLWTGLYSAEDSTKFVREEAYEKYPKRQFVSF